MAKPIWITLDKASGTGNSTLQVTAAAFTGRLERTGLITARTDGGAQDSTAVTQEGKAEFIAVTSPAEGEGVADVAVPAAGYDITILGKSNSAALKVEADPFVTIKSLKINSVLQEDWDGKENITLPGDPGASAEYEFEIIVSIPENKTESALTGKTIKIDNSNAEDSVEAEISWFQAAGVKTYSEITITTELAYTDIPASGGSVSPNQITYSQTWGWNGATTGGGTITTGAEIRYAGSSVNPSTGEVTAPSLGTTAKARTKIGQVAATVTLNGKTKNTSADIYQAANTASYGEVTIQLGAGTDIPASGGSVSQISGTTGTQTVTFTSGSERAGEVEISYGDAVTGANLATTVKSRTQVGTLDVTATGEGGKTAEEHVPIYQQANAATYGEVTIGMVTPVSVPAEGKEYNIKQLALAKQTVSYTSGASRDESSPLSPVTILVGTVEITPQTGFTLDDTDILTVAANTSVDAREGYVLEIVATGEGGKEATKQITFNQQGLSSQITLEPDTLEFDAAGGQKSVTVTSTDDWSIS